MNQTAEILNHLRNKGPLTPLKALRDYQCFRLGARVYDLKQDGWNISTVMVKRGEKRFAQYSLIGRMK